MTSEQKTLVLTVGGSPQPLMTAIRHHGPDRIVFVCSHDDPVTGSPGSYREVPGIVASADAASTATEIVQVPADDPAQVFVRAREVLTRARSEGQVVADFTGGTKAMSAGLYLAAILVEGVEVRLVTGPRVDLIKVRDGQERVRGVEGAPVRTIWLRTRAEDAWRSHRYRDAAKLLADVGDVALERLRILSEGYAAWDEMDHAAARDRLISLTRVRGLVEPEHLAALTALIAHASAERGAASPAEEAMAVADVWTMAERRQKQGMRDASALLRYRVLEAMAQWSLRHHHGIDASDVAVDAPEAARAHATTSHRGRLVLSMEAGWCALAELDGPLAEVARQTREQRQVLATTRNGSVFAHGFRPVREKELELGRQLLEERFLPAFWSAAFRRATPPFGQLPDRLPEALDA